MTRRVLAGAALAAAAWLDAVQLHLFGLPAAAAVVLAVALLAPVVVAVTRPLLAWHLATAGLASCVVIFGIGVGPGYNDAGWPWPVCAMAGFGLVLFRVAVRSPDRLHTASTALVTVLAVYLPGLLLADTSPTTAGILTAATVGVVSWGDSVRTRLAAQAALAEQTEREHEARRAQMVLAERARIARELHDVVAHHVSMIAIQAEAAPLRIDALPDQAVQTFDVIRVASRDALTELRRLLGLLRSADGAPELAPQPGLADLPELVRGAVRGGILATLTTSGTPVELPGGVAVSVYRIAQEALSNAVRHAPGSTVDVTVRYEDHLVRLSVRNSGPARAARGGPPGAGLGLVGMRERVAGLGGTLRAGPLGTGFEVVAELPVGKGAE